MRPRLGRALRRRRRLRSGLIQLIYVALGVALGLIVPEIGAGFTVSGEEARGLLIGVGAAMVPFIGIVYSLLFLVVQFGTTTFTPRLNIFRDSPIVWHAFAFFIAVLVYCFTATFALGTDEDASGWIPVLTMLLVLAAMGLFRSLQTSAFQSIQLAWALDQVVQRGREVIEGVYPAEVPGTNVNSSALGDERSATGTAVHPVVWRRRSAVLQVVDVPHLVRTAERADVVIELRVGMGEMVLEHDDVALVHGERSGGLDRQVLQGLATGQERTFEQDPAFALRVLADIALRALSPAVNDPTTAVQALDSIDSLLRLLAGRDLDVKSAYDQSGRVRVLLALPGWEELLGLGVDEIIEYGSRSSQVRRRLEALLERLASLVQPAGRDAVESRLGVIRDKGG
jgi:uncharacterized membrane protein